MNSLFKSRFFVLVTVLTLSSYAFGGWEFPKGFDGNYLPLLALTPDLQPPSFKTLRTSAVPSKDTAFHIALGYINMFQSAQVVGLYQAGEIAGFAGFQDWI